jgi:hypothetical protein
MGLSLGSIGQFALNAANPTLAVIAEHQRAAQEARQQALAQQILQIKLQREGDEQAARTRYYNAGADQRETEPVQYKQDASGQWYALPSRQGPGSGARVGGDGASPGAPPVSFNPMVKGSTTQYDANAGGRAGDMVERASSMLAPSAQGVPVAASPSQSPRGIMIGQPTGIIGPTKAAPGPRPASAVVNGRTVLGRVNQSGVWSPDTTAQGDTVYGRTPANVRGGTPDAQLNHTINNVRAQIAETQQQLNAAKKAAAAANGILATPEQKAAAASSNAQAITLQQRLDSLSKVHDVLNARQQAGIELTPLPGRAPAPRARGASGLPPEDVAAMQAEFDDASRSLQTILNAPTATPADKAQARQLYDQQQRAVADKYGQRVRQP